VLTREYRLRPAAAAGILWFALLTALLLCAGGTRGARAQDSLLPAPGPATATTAPTATGPGRAAEEPPAVAAPAPGGVRTAMVDWFVKGGIFMWPLLACSIIGVALILERWYTLSRARINTRKFIDRLLSSLRDQGVDGAIEVCTRTPGPIAAVLHSGLMRADKGPDAVTKAIESAGVIEMAYLQRSLIWLASITVIAPLLGFLGTVSGMINAFDAIAAADQVSAKVVANGISEALITTEAGLCIAIPVQTAYNWFITKIDKFITEMEASSVEVVDTLVDLEHQRQQAQPGAARS
jgi:biopolymer transport protein ExbB